MVQQGFGEDTAGRIVGAQEQHVQGEGSANDDVRVAVVGFGGRGKDHLGGLSK